MAVVTELQAELLAALLNSGVSSETIIQALKAGERQTRPECPKLEKVTNGTSEEQSATYAATGVASTEQQDTTIAAPMTELETSGQSIAEQLMRNDPWQSAKIIKQYMQQHNIPQREAVETTGLNQSHLSQHLNKGTPMKTQKRLTLYKWFEAKQREVAAQYNSTSGKRLVDHDVSSPLFAGASSYKRARRNRFKWGQASTEILYQAYDTQRNPSKDEREALVRACNQAECEQRGIPLEQVNNLGPNLVTESRVYNWFANRRKEEAFKVKLAIDAGTYSVLGPSGTEMTSTPDAKLTPATNEKVTYATKSPLPTLSSTPLTKLSSAPAEGNAGTRTPVPVTRLPTMSLIKCEQNPTTSLTQTPTLPYTHQIPQNSSTVLQRPISVAFGTMPPQILTPTQLQVITGLMPSQVVPISHAGANIVGQSGEVATAGAVPPGHVTNLMLPGQLGAQPIPMQAVTLMSMTGGTSQVFYSMPGHSPVVPVSVANVTTSSSAQCPVSSHLPVGATAGASSTTPAVQIASQSTIADSNNQRNSPLIVPQIASIQRGSSPTVQLSGSAGVSLPSQIYTQMVFPVATSLTNQIQSPQTAVARPSLLSKTEVSRMQPVPALQLPSISQLGTPARIQTATPAVSYERVPGLQQDNGNDEMKALGSLNAEDTLVVEMKPVDQVDKVSEGITGNTAGGGDQQSSIHTVAVPLVPENGENVNDSSFKEPTLTLSEEGVVALGGAGRNGSDVATSVHMMVESSR